MIFQLEWASYDCTSIHTFEGPDGATEEGFRGLCNQLMHEALQDAVDGKPGRCDLHENPPYWLGYDYGVDEITVRLADHGYKEVTFPTVSYVHNTIIDGRFDEEGNGSDYSGGLELEPGLRAAVAEYNAKMHRDMREDALRRKILARTEIDLPQSVS